MNYTEIADKATLILGSVDISRYLVAYDVMRSELSDSSIDGDVLVTEGIILSKLGSITGGQFIDILEQNFHPAVIRVLRSSGININDAQTIAALDQMLSLEIITQNTYDTIRSLRFNRVHAWPGLKPGHVQDALIYRQEGKI